MKTLFGAIVVDGRGKLGGHVASKNRHGSYFRTKVSQANQQVSIAQMSVPALLQSLRHGEGFSKLPASFGIMQFRTSKGRTYLALSIVLQGSIFTKS